MARFPGAIWKPITANKGRKRMAVYNRVNLHVAVSEAASLHGYFNARGRVDSHFYVRKDGTVEQYVDTAMRAFADLEGNDATISIETQGGVNSPQTEPWTNAQLDALAALVAWAHRAHGIPLRLARDSRIGASSHGLSWHRLGIDPWRVSGGMRYSTSRGKVCPGNAKIAQIPTVLARAQRVSNPSTGGGSPTVPTPGGTRPDPLEADVLNEADKQFLRDLMAYHPKVTDERPDGTTTEVRAATAHARTLKIAREVREHTNTILLAVAQGQKITAKAVADALLPGLIEPVVAGIGTDLGMTVEQVEAAVDRALADLTITRQKG